MRFTYISILALITLSSAKAAQFVSTQAEFNVFSEKTVKDPTSIEKNWDAFEAHYQPIYDKIVYNKGSERWQERRARVRADFFANFFNLKDKMKNLYDQAERITKERESNFKGVFTDLPNDIPVYFLPSLLTFNGKATKVPGTSKTALCMAVDSLISRGDDVKVVFSHEFFHAYHSSKLAEGSTGRTMASPLWLEGFATYVSGILNPGRADEVLLVDGELGKQCADSKFVRLLATRYLSVLDSDGPYEEWFLMSQPEFPRRSRLGYCLGLKVVREIAKTHNLLDMTTWPEIRFSPEIRRQLEILSKP